MPNPLNQYTYLNVVECFRWNKQEDGSYTGIFKNNVINVKKENNNIIFSGICEGDIKEICTEYFDLKTDYEGIKENYQELMIT